MTISAISQGVVQAFHSIGNQIRSLIRLGPGNRPPDPSPNFLDKFAAFEFVSTIKWAASGVGHAIQETYTRFADWLTGSPPQPAAANLPAVQVKAPSFTVEEERKARRLVREAALMVETDRLKEQEADMQIRLQSKPAVKRKTIPDRHPDPTEEEKFKDWGAPAGPPVTTEATADTLEKHSSKRRRAKIAKEVRQVVRALIPPRSILKKDDPSGIPIPRASKRVRFSGQDAVRHYRADAAEEAEKSRDESPKKSGEGRRKEGERGKEGSGS